MLFAEGTYINKGQTLFVIDPTIYRARVNKAKALLNKAKAHALKAERDLNRIKPLYEQNAASQLDLDNAIAAYEGAVADVVVCEADLTQAELTLGYTSVQSPISGYISERNVDIGTLVGPGSKSCSPLWVKSDTVRIDFSMTALDYLRSKERNVNIGQRDSLRTWDPYVTVTLADGSKYPYRGLVDFADPQVDPKTGTFSVRAEMPNPARALLPGEFTKVTLLMDVRKNAVVVPSKALIIEKAEPTSMWCVPTVWLNAVLCGDRSRNRQQNRDRKRTRQLRMDRSGRISQTPARHESSPDSRKRIRRR